MCDEVLCVVPFHAHLESPHLDLVRSTQILLGIPHSIWLSGSRRQEYLLTEQKFRVL